jgi:hypothetical protein
VNFCLSAVHDGMMKFQKLTSLGGTELFCVEHIDAGEVKNAVKELNLSKNRFIIIFLNCLGAFCSIFFLHI